MKIERVEHPFPPGHKLNAMLKAWREPWLAEHYAGPPTLASARAAAGRRQQNTARAPVVARLERENARLGNARGASLCAELARPDALVVMCGQQPGLFGGALLSFEKAAGAIALARRLASELGVPVVPVYWNQSEDHDLEEANRLEVLRPDGVARTRAPIEDLGRTLDSIVIDDGILAFAHDALVEVGLDAAPIEGLLPVRGERFPDWTSRVLLQVFGEAGILIAEPSCFRGLAAPIVRRAITEAPAIHDAFVQATEALAAHGIEPQVEARDPSMLFRLAPDGTRRRLYLRDDGWEEDKTGARFATEDLLARLETDPAAFSQNVQLRAIVQQHLFPVVAQVGGPAEVAYFAQFPHMFRLFGLPLPPMFVRPESTVLGPKEAAARAAMGLSARTLLEGPRAWPDLDVDDSVRPLADLLAARRGDVVEAAKKHAGNDALRRAVEGYEKALAIADDKLLGAFRRDREREAGVISNRRARLETWVFPRGKPQDRVFGILPVLARASLGAVRAWLETMDPLDTTHVICTFEESDR